MDRPGQGAPPPRRLASTAPALHRRAASPLTAMPRRPAAPPRPQCPGAKGQKHRILKGGHFIQEDIPEELCELIQQFVKDNPMPINPPFAKYQSRL